MRNLFENFKLVYGCEIGERAIYLNVNYREKQIEREIVLIVCMIVSKVQ